MEHKLPLSPRVLIHPAPNGYMAIVTDALPTGIKADSLEMATLWATKIIVEEGLAYLTSAK